MLQRLAQNLADLLDGVLCDHASIAKNEYIRTNLLNHLEHMRTVEDEFALLTQSLDQVLEDQCGSDIETGERFIKDKDLRVVHQGSDKKDPLAHSLRIGADDRVAVSVQRKKFEQRVNLLLQLEAWHSAQGSDQFQIFPTRQVRVQMRLFGHVPEELSVSFQVVANVAAVEQNHAAGGLQQSG